MSDHAPLVATAQRLLPGTLVHEVTYEQFRDHVRATINDHIRHLAPRERLDEAYRLCYRGRCGPHREWWERFEAEVVDAFRARLGL